MATSNRPPRNAPTLTIFDQIRNDPKFNHRRSVDWFKKKIGDLGGNSPTARTDLLAETKKMQYSFVLPGAMYMFMYDPKYKDELPYYDKFPLSLIFAEEGDRFWGINFHYLSYKVRGILFDKMWLIASRYHDSQERVQRMNWKLLSNVSKFPEVRPAVKSYLYTQVRSRFIRVPVEDWKTAIFLPVDMFAKKSQGAVASLSGMAIRKIASR